MCVIVFSCIPIIGLKHIAATRGIIYRFIYMHITESIAILMSLMLLDFYVSVSNVHAVFYQKLSCFHPKMANKLVSIEVQECTYNRGP